MNTSSPMQRLYSLYLRLWQKNLFSPRQWKSVKAYQHGLRLLREEMGTSSPGQIVWSAPFNSPAEPNPVMREPGKRVPQRHTSVPSRYLDQANKGLAPLGMWVSSSASGQIELNLPTAIGQGKRILKTPERISNASQSRASNSPGSVVVGDDTAPRCTNCLRKL